MNAAGQTSHQSLLHDSFDSFFQLIRVVFLDSIVFFLTLGFCMLAPRVFVISIKHLTRWTLSAENQKALCIVLAAFFAFMHLFLTLLFGLYDDTGVSPNAPSVFWAVMWSTGVIVGIEGGLLVATVVVLIGLQLVGI
jgi:hypothetical protein